MGVSLRAFRVGTAVALALAAFPPMAGADDLGVGEGARAVTLPSFNESAGCDGPLGVVGPYASRSGGVSPEEAVLGPWGDFFGRSMEEVHASLVAMELPGTDRPFIVYVHARVVPALEQVIENLEGEAAAGRVYTIRADFTGSYNPITVPPGRRMGFHTVGAAIDVNSDTNPYRQDDVLVSDMPAWFVAAWTDAGWCWGGSWQEVKDPMHFSWRGPRYTPGYETPAPYPAKTQASTFRSVVTFDTALGEAPPGSVHLVADMNRDGAPDAVRLRPWTPFGHVGVEAAIGQHDFETCLLHDITVQPPRGGAGYTLADWTGDGRPDLWAFDGGGDTVRIEIYRWESRYRRRVVIRPNVATDHAVAYLAGDHDRDGHTDLFVIRAGSPGSVEIWAGPRFANLLERADLDVAISADDRIALGDYDGDGVPDVYLVAPGDAADLRVALGGQGNAVVGPMETSVGAHPGSILQVTDYDGDGRDDLVFFDEDGRATVYLGGRRAAGENLTGWFSESFNRHWQLGEGCAPNPGFETEPGFRATRFADAAGPGAAFAYPNPATGIWTLAALDWSWWWRLPGRLVDLEPVTGPEGPGYAALLTGAGTTLQLRPVDDGQAYLTIPVSGRTDPVDLAVVAQGGAAALAVAFGGDEPGVVVRDLAGGLLAEIDLVGLSPMFLLAAGDVTGDGEEDLVAVGYLPGGAVGLVTISLGEGVVARAPTLAGFAVERATVLPAAEDRAPSLAVLLRHRGGRRGAVVVQDVMTGERLTLFRIAPIATGALTAASTEDGPILVVAGRNARTGRVWVEGRAPGSGARLWMGSASLGFDPADADQIETGAVAILGHRFGDGNVEVAWWDPASGQRLG
jgi:hypothetical protein